MSFANTLNQRGILLLLVSLAAISLPHLQNLPPALSGFFAGLLAWRAAALRHERWLPGRLLLLLLTLLGIALLISLHKGIFGRDAGTAIIMVATALKLFELRERRDFYLLVFLGFMITATVLLYQQSILIAAYLLLACGLLLTTLIVYGAGSIGYSAALKTAVAILLQAVPLAIAVFVLFPRVEAPRWRWLEDDNQAKSGLSKVLEPGAISQMSLSDELVFRVRFAGEVPPPAQRYWRGPVYSHTDGVRWTVSSRNYPNQGEPGFSGPVYRYTLLMEPQKEHWVFALDMASEFDAELQRSSLYELLTRRNPGSRAEYRLSSQPDYRTGPASRAELLDNLQLPETASPPLQQLVQQLGGLDGQADVFIANLLQHFRRENFVYTLTPPLLDDKPIERFLFETRRGFCSHYAGAFVYLLRIAGIPARIVGGYQGGEFNPVGGFWEIRQAEAHAWAEAWLGERGWVRFDPTAAIAPERVERGVNIEMQLASGEVNFQPLAEGSLNWLKATRQLWRNVDYHWQRWVVNYSPQNQLRLLQRFGIDGLLAIVQWLTISVIGIALLLAGWLLRKRHGKHDPVIGCYRRFCAKLANAGVVIATGEGPLDFATRAKRQRPDLAAAIDTITSLYLRLRYEPQAQHDDLRRLRAQVKALKIRV